MDPSLFPVDLLRKATTAQAELETKTTHLERVEFIKANAALWREFATYLKQMSYGKCWYSESDDPQAFFDVDHFRPKARARRARKQLDEGYPWLAFSPENFRLSAQRSNRRNTDEEADEVVGKGDWFPLADGSPIANWGNRCVDDERPLLLDPTVRADIDLIEVGSDARIAPSRLCFGLNIDRVETSLNLYGLNLPGITAARKRAMRDVAEAFETLHRNLAAASRSAPLFEDLGVASQVQHLRVVTKSNRPFARAARAQLALLGGAEFGAGPEDIP
jgi:hypothetical protein